MGTLLLVRHGQASFGTEEYDRLSETGWQQARVVGEWLAAQGVFPDTLVTGGLRRHEETARGMQEGAHWMVATDVDPRWDELDSDGVLAALPGIEEVDLDDRVAFQAAYQRALVRWVSGSHDAEYRQTWRSFSDGVRAALTDAATRAGPGRTALVVGSGGSIAVALCAALHRSPQIDREAWLSFTETSVNTGVSRLLVGASRVRLSTVNEHLHLAGQVTYR